MTDQDRALFVEETLDVWRLCLNSAIQEQNVKSALSLCIAIEVLEETYEVNGDANGLVNQYVDSSQK